MNWKKFLKPEWRKILVLILIGLIAYLLGHEVWGLSLGVLEVISPADCFFIPIWLGTFISSFFATFPDVAISGKRVIGHYLCIKPVWSLPLFPLIDILYWYFLSCFIIWIYDKVKKK